MANKRQLKKAICRTCGDVAGEIIFASETFGQAADIEKWDQLILDTALLQAEAVSRVSKAFDKKPSEFENAKEFYKARRTYSKKVAGEITELMTNSLQEIANKMNALMPKKG